ncbi:hypothetical protein [Streptomyces sp. B21-083]|uniref:hypothetical protein n=1 Tax=Streptomyces sp. B21-083 TaxID=3039410 RepID=UPI002FF1CA9A
MESAQLGLAGELVQEAQHTLDGRRWTPGELHLLAVQLTEALTNIHRIAVSRGACLPAPAYDDLDTLDLDDLETGDEERDSPGPVPLD